MNNIIIIFDTMICEKVCINGIQLNNGIAVARTTVSVVSERLTQEAKHEIDVLLV